MGTEDTRAYFAQEIRNLHRPHRFVDVDDSEVMEVFHEINEPDRGVAQTSCDLRWAALTRQAVLNEELTGLGLVPHHFSVRSEDNLSELPGTFRTSDDLRAEVSPLRIEQEDKLDETRSNEAHLRHVIHQQDPCNIQGPCPSKPFEGLEQCLSWHRRAWGSLPLGCSCHRRRNLRSYHGNQSPGNATASRIQWLTYMRDIAFPTSLSRMVPDVPSTRRTEHEPFSGYPQMGVPSTYLASRPLLGGDGQDSEGVAGYGQKSARRTTRVKPTLSRTTEHEDSRRLASGLSADLSSTHAEDSGHGRQTDPGDRRTSDWRTPTLGSDAAPSTGRPMSVSPTLIGSSSGPPRQVQGLERSHFTSREKERDTAGNASRILMTGLQRPGQRGVTMHSGADNRRDNDSSITRKSAWLWAKLLQEEYPSEGYSMNTRSTPREVEALQARAREYTRRQLEQMDEWERAFYREWTSLISRNALAFLYPMERESEAQTLTATPIRGYIERESEAQALMATPIRGYIERESEAQTLIATPIRGYVGGVGGSASSTDILVPGFHDRPHRDGNTNPLLRTTEGTLEDGTTTSESIQTTPAFQNGDKTMCSLVGDNKRQGLIISRLYTETRTYLVVAVENASVLLPPAYLVRIAG